MLTSLPHTPGVMKRAANILANFNRISRGETIPHELLAHVAPLGWEHIAFNGDYVWPAEPLGAAFRPLRNPQADFLEAA